MDTQREVFSEATEVQNKVGGPWNMIKNVLTNLKDQMLGNPQSQDLSNEASASSHNPGLPEFTTPQNNLQNAEPDSVVQCTEAIPEWLSEKQIDLTKSPFQKDKQVSVSAISHNMKDVYPEESKHNSNLDTNKLGGKENKIQPSESLKVSWEGKIPKKKISLVDVNQPVESKGKKMPRKEEASSIPGGFQTNKKNGNERLHCVATDLLGNAMKTLFSNVSEEVAAAGSLNRSLDRMNSSPDGTSTIKTSGVVRSISNCPGKEMVSSGESSTSSVSAELSIETTWGKDTEVGSIADTLIKCIEGPSREQSSLRSEDDFFNTKTGVKNEALKGKFKAAVILGKGKSKEGKIFSEGRAMSVDDNVGNSYLGKNRHSQGDLRASQVRQTPSKCISMVLGEEFNTSNTIEGKPKEEAIKSMLKVLGRTYVAKKSGDLIPETTPSLEDYSDIIPNLVGDPGVPIALVKNPTRTVLIKHLSNGICSHHLKEALAFCGCSIASISFGASSSVAYVEFETDGAKERAIAKHSIEIKGVQLTILRIDVPRTTVVRLSTSDLVKVDATLDKVLSVCFPHEQKKQLISSKKRRSSCILDVTFAMNQWPNMLNILNRLNGVIVDGVRFTAQPAPVFPPEILQLLWRDPVERRGVLAVMRSLLTEVNNPNDSCGFNDLLGKYYGENFK